VFFDENVARVASHGPSRATLIKVARLIASDHIRDVTITATSDSLYVSSYNRLLSLRRARSTASALSLILRSLHVALPHFTDLGGGVSTSFRGLASNRRATIVGVVKSS
jgi:hypothetical protein